MSDRNVASGLLDLLFLLGEIARTVMAVVTPEDLAAIKAEADNGYRVTEEWTPDE